MAWLLTCLISLYTYRIQPPLQRLHTGHLHSNHVTATSLIVVDSFSPCTVEFDVEIRNHFWIWSRYTWEDAPRVARFSLHLAKGSFCSGAARHALVLPLEGLEKNQQLGNFWQHFTMGTGPCFKLQHGRSVTSYNTIVGYSGNIWGVYVNMYPIRIFQWFLPKVFQLRVEGNKFPWTSMNIEEEHIFPCSGKPVKPHPFLAGFPLLRVNKKPVIFFHQKPRRYHRGLQVLPGFGASSNTSCQMVVIDGRLMFFFSSIFFGLQFELFAISLTPSQWMR